MFQNTAKRRGLTTLAALRSSVSRTRKYWEVGMPGESFIPLQGAGGKRRYLVDEDLPII
jgi:hypothetical protein